MLRIKLLAWRILACLCAVTVVSAVALAVGKTTSPVVASAAPLPTAVPLSAAPSPRPGRTTVTSPFAAIDSAYAALGQAISDYKAGHPVPVPSPAPSPSPQPSPQPPPVVSRFPGDPGAGKTIVGAATSGGNLARVQLHEKATGVPLGVRRRYLNNGASDLGGANSPIGKWVIEDQAAGRIPLISVKLGAWQPIAAGKFDAQLREFFTWAETLPKVTMFIEQHEPQDQIGQLGTAADFRAAQKHIRDVLNSVTGGHPKRVSFGGSLQAYGWTSQGIAKFGPVDDWFPGAGVWDWAGIDQYAQQAGGPIIDAKYVAAVASIKKWGVPLAVTELGIRDQDPQAGQKLADFYTRAVSDGAVLISYYDSNVNSTQDGWEMDDTHGQLSEFHALMKDARTVEPNR